MNKQLFIVKVRKSEASSEDMLPRHQEFEFVRQINDGVWQAKNLENNHMFMISRIEKGDFYFFEVEQLNDLE